MDLAEHMGPDGENNIISGLQTYIPNWLSLEAIGFSDTVLGPLYIRGAQCFIYFMDVGQGSDWVSSLSYVDFIRQLVPQAHLKE